MCRLLSRSRLGSMWLAVPILSCLGIPSLGCASQQGGPSASSSTAQWAVDVGNVAQAGFGVRLWINGEVVYSETAPQAHHAVRVTRIHQGGQQVVEAEILSAATSPSVYAMSVTLAVVPAGRVVHADGVPTSLEVGQRLRMTL